MAGKLRASLRRLRAVAVKEIRQLARDRVTFGMIVGVPLMQMLLFGFAINFDVRHLATVVQDEANSSMSREFLAQLQATQVVNVSYVTRSSAELDRLMREGRASMAVVIPHDFERRLQSDARPVVQILVDGSQPSLSGVAAGIAQMPLLARHGEGAYAGGKRMTPRRIEIRTWYNPEKRTAVQIVPALIGVILSMTMVLFTSGAIVRERERGNLELLIATPLGRLELMVGKLLPYVAIGLIQTTLILVVGSLLFTVPVVGSLWQLYAAALLFIALIWVARRLEPAKVATPTGWPVWLLLLLILVQIAAGAFVAGLDAGMGYNTWPLMDGALVPAGLDAIDPFWKNLFENTLTVQFIHRMIAYAVVLYVGWLLWRQSKVDGQCSQERRVRFMIDKVVRQWDRRVENLHLGDPAKVVVGNRRCASAVADNAEHEDERYPDHCLVAHLRSPIARLSEELVPHYFATRTVA
jgi:ABC-2 type transport system permease protein